MNIEEFSHQMAREDQPSELMRALRTLSLLEMDWLRDLGRIIKSDWGIWTEFKPGAGAERAEPQR